jgi:hypothetical protein
VGEARTAYIILMKDCISRIIGVQNTKSSGRVSATEMLIGGSILPKRNQGPFDPTVSGNRVNLWDHIFC